MGPPWSPYMVSGTGFPVELVGARGPGLSTAFCLRGAPICPRTQCVRGMVGLLPYFGTNRIRSAKFKSDSHERKVMINQVWLCQDFLFFFFFNVLFSLSLFSKNRHASPRLEYSGRLELESHSLIESRITCFKEES